MKVHSFSLFIVLMALSVTTSFALAKDIESTKQSSSFSFTPPPGDPVRIQILDTLRQEVKKMNGVEAVFVVSYLKVKDGWAWVHTLPQSADGTNHYEDISALLHVENGVWKIVEIPCTEIENPECLGEPGYFGTLKKRFPDLPSQILPEE
ncbi:MAG: hypothetical protein IE885_08945 [Campylobacterales bacterium]|nr:hypothetical protein [Campylobacterales bacterium]